MSCNELSNPPHPPWGNADSHQLINEHKGGIWVTGKGLGGENERGISGTAFDQYITGKKTEGHNNGGEGVQAPRKLSLLTDKTRATVNKRCHGTSVLADNDPAPPHTHTHSGPNYCESRREIWRAVYGKMRNGRGRRGGSF